MHDERHSCYSVGPYVLQNTGTEKDQTTQAQVPFLSFYTEYYMKNPQIAKPTIKKSKGLDKTPLGQTSESHSGMCHLLLPHSPFSLKSDTFPKTMHSHSQSPCCPTSFSSCADNSIKRPATPGTPKLLATPFFSLLVPRLQRHIRCHPPPTSLGLREGFPGRDRTALGRGRVTAPAAGAPTRQLGEEDPGGF